MDCGDALPTVAAMAIHCTAHLQLRVGFGRFVAWSISVETTIQGARAYPLFGYAGHHYWVSRDAVLPNDAQKYRNFSSAPKRNNPVVNSLQGPFDGSNPRT